jgi:peptide-methionine (S)-S-oxide reductase
MQATAVFGGGCFWCIEAIFQRLKGVNHVSSGYTGGKSKNPSYKEVCSGLSGHAEVIKIEYDSDIISYKELLLVFFNLHNPTTLNRQGNDVGTQYRSGIYYSTDEEKAIAESFIKNEANALWDDPIVTEVKPLENYYPAEDYHQNYFNNNPNQGYCNFIIRPKLTKLNQKFKALLKDEN